MTAQSAAGSEQRLALGAGAGCYVIWGFMPLLFQFIARQGGGPWEILAQRTVWAIPPAALFVVLANQQSQFLAVVRQPKVLGLLAISACLISLNWALYITAVNTGRVLETSLGYFITPLFNIAGGALLFRERMDGSAKVAIGLAAAGIALQTVAIGQLPIISIILAMSFSTYGLVRKQVAADAQTGLLIECLMLGACGLAYVLWLERSGGGHFLGDAGVTAAFVFAGIITAVPLMMFSWSARRIPLSAIGFLQFITPTITFFMGVLQGEPFTWLRGVSFVFIWIGAGVFLWGAWRRSRLAAAAAQSAA
ncbi:MAG: EamA family transporter RarD [Phenylobacterium sp.]|uniref:EamA family transporter RarD n=1 Tax=Phenylobacterium sp. TaxID=1871053 RepID=UPI0027347847|nr:EamA family transporter RarD [Phenylobacterium sp.]MDP3173852.1 EamA family transporter RarD [Phenylobacterium sp.]